MIARGLLAEGVGKGARVAVLLPTGIPFVVDLAGDRRGSERWPCRSARSRTPTSCATSSLAPTSATLIGDRPAYRGNDYVDALHEACGLDLSRRGRADRRDAVVAPRAFEGGDAGGVHHRPLAARSSTPARRSTTVCSRAVEADVSPGDRMVIVHTSGSTSAPKGVIHEHGPLMRHLENLNALAAARRGREALLELADVLDRRPRLQRRSARSWPARPSCARTASTGGATLDFVERERPELVNGFAQSIANLMADPTFGVTRLLVDPLGQPLPDHARGRAPADPELRHNMLGMTEAGSVCLMDPDESDQPEHRRGSFGRPVPELEARVVDPETLAERRPASLGELWLRGPLLMEGYYGRERWTTFTPDEWYRTGDALPPRRRGLPLLPRAARRHDQDRWGERVARARSRACCTTSRAVCCRSCSASPTPSAARSSPQSSSTDADVPLDIDALRDALRAKLSAYKVPRRIVRFTPTELPMLSSGKPDMRRLAEVVGES